MFRTHINGYRVSRGQFAPDPSGSLEVTATRSGAWINVAARKDSWGYNLRERRWSYGHDPQLPAEVWQEILAALVPAPRPAVTAPQPAPQPRVAAPPDPGPRPALCERCAALPLYSAADIPLHDRLCGTCRAAREAWEERYHRYCQFRSAREVADMQFRDSLD